MPAPRRQHDGCLAWRRASRDTAFTASVTSSVYRFIYRPRLRREKLHRFLPWAKATRKRRYFKRRRDPIPGRTSIHERPQAARRSATLDNGSEFALHENLNAELATQTYFCDPHSPWQRGTIENTNGLLRRDMPRKINLHDYTARDIDDLTWAINSTPRKFLGYKTPGGTLPRKPQVLHLICESSDFRQRLVNFGRRNRVGGLFGMAIKLVDELTINWSTLSNSALYVGFQGKW